MTITKEQLEKAAKQAGRNDAPQQEAVAYRYKDRSGYICYEATTKLIPSDLLGGVEPLYLHPAPSVPEGWQLVPKEPTAEILDAICDAKNRQTGHGHRCVMTQSELAILYRAMLSAAPKAPTTDDRKDAERLRGLRELCGYVEDGSSDVVHISQDDATYDWIVSVGRSGKIRGYGPSLGQAIEAAMAAQKEPKG